MILRSSRPSQPNHEDAGERGIFGTPTFLFENGHAAYMKTFIPPEDEAVEVFESFASLFGDAPMLARSSRRSPPWPKGALD